LIENAKVDAELYQALNNGHQLLFLRKRLPTVGNYNIWPFVTMAFFQQLQTTIRIQVGVMFIYRVLSDLIIRMLPMSIGIKEKDSFPFLP